MPEITYRRAAKEDAGAIAGLERVCFPDDSWSEGMILEEIENDSAAFIVAEDGEKIVGCAMAWMIAPYECQIGTIEVLPEYRRRGIALNFMQKLMKISRLLGIWDILLEVRVSNAPAIALYESLGFVKDGIRKNYYPGGEDACNMSLHMPRPEEGFL